MHVYVLQKSTYTLNNTSLLSVKTDEIFWNLRKKTRLTDWKETTYLPQLVANLLIV